MDYEDLKVWNKAHELTLKIYKITEKFPSEEQYRLTDQICRSASSVPANIAEGTGRQTLKEYAQFLYNARGSIEETKYHLRLSKDLGYLDQNSYEKFKNGYETVGKMLNGLINSIQEKQGED